MDKYNFMHVFKSDINTVCVCIRFTAATKSHFCHSSSGDKINCFLQQRWHWKYWYDFPFPWVLIHWQTTDQDQSCSNRCLRTVRMRLQKNAEKSIESDRSTEQQVDSLLFHSFLFFLPSMHYMLVFYFVIPPPHIPFLHHLLLSFLAGAERKICLKRPVLITILLSSCLRWALPVNTHTLQRCAKSSVGLKNIN